VRQVFYQAMVRGMVPKDESKGYKLVQRRLVKLREAVERHLDLDRLRVMRLAEEQERDLLRKSWIR
jgi:hypothetical protein